MEELEGRDLRDRHQGFGVRAEGIGEQENQKNIIRRGVGDRKSEE